MKMPLIIGVSLALSFSITQAQAASLIENIVYAETPASGYFYCSYKLKIASKKCFVETTQVSTSIDPRTMVFYGANQIRPLITIAWPDGDRSRYIAMDSFEVINLADQKSYRYKTSEMEDWDIDLTRGLIIMNEDNKEHVHLW